MKRILLLLLLGKLAYAQESINVTRWQSRAVEETFGEKFKPGELSYVLDIGRSKSPNIRTSVSGLIVVNTDNGNITCSFAWIRPNLVNQDNFICDKGNMTVKILDTDISVENGKWNLIFIKRAALFEIFNLEKENQATFMAPIEWKSEPREPLESRKGRGHN